MTQAPKQQSKWLRLTQIPEAFATETFVFEPLHEKHAELDFEAIMSCRRRLRHELKWNGWPPDSFTLEYNQEDLRRHFSEYAQEVAFAFTVLRKDRQQCLGCIYIERCDEIDGAQLAFWLVDSALNHELSLVADVLGWLHRDWQITQIAVPIHDDNERGVKIANELGLEETQQFSQGPLVNHRCFLSHDVSQGSDCL